MGGNVTAVNKKTGEETRARKIELDKTGRATFTRKFIQLFKELNKIHLKQFKQKIWVDENKLVTGELFNGSTSYIFDQSISDEEILKHKPSAGDLDIIVPETMKESIWTMLDELEGEEVIKGIKYVGSNKPTISSIGEQINALFIAEFDGYKAFAQVDFEFLPVDDEGSPSDWAKFSHSSSFEDAKKGVKAVHHKYLIQALAGGASARDDIVIVTSKAEFNPGSKNHFDKKIVGGKKALEIPRLLKFSVVRGIGIAYEPLLDLNGKIVKYEGKDVYREIPTSDRNYATTAEEIYKLAFGRIEDHPEDVKLFWSFIGIVELIKKYMDDKSINNTHKRYVEKLWGGTGGEGQVLEVGNKELDFQVKNSGYQYFCKELGLKSNMQVADKYYENFENLRGGDTVSESMGFSRLLTFGEFIQQDSWGL